MNLFSKPAMAIPEQLTRLQAQGLTIEQPEQAGATLTAISYFRLTAYMLPFFEHRQSRRFVVGTQFEKIIALYEFDRHLRLLVIDAIERVEVAVRAAINNHMALNHQDEQPHSGSHWYLKPHHFNRHYDHARLLAEIEALQRKEANALERDIQKIERSGADTEQRQQRIRQRIIENYPRFYQHTYTAPPLMPSWAMMEHITFGSLSHLYQGLARDADRKAVARQFALPQDVMTSWLHTLTFVRNCCAHHGRLWNRELAIQPKIPQQPEWQWAQVPASTPISPQRRLYLVLMMLAHLLRSISPQNQWPQRIAALLQTHTSLPLQGMGLPANWQQDPFWQGALAPQQQGEQR